MLSGGLATYRSEGDMDELPTDLKKTCAEMDELPTDLKETCAEWWMSYLQI